MKRNAAVIILLGLVAIFCMVAMTPWIIEGPRRLIRRLVSGKSDNRASDVPTSIR
jgi:hypothetical protein